MDYLNNISNDFQSFWVLILLRSLRLLVLKGPSTCGKRAIFGLRSGRLQVAPNILDGRRQQRCCYSKCLKCVLIWPFVICDGVLHDFITVFHRGIRRICELTKYQSQRLFAILMGSRSYLANEVIIPIHWPFIYGAPIASVLAKLLLYVRQNIIQIDIDAEDVRKKLVKLLTKRNSTQDMTWATCYDSPLVL